MKSRRWGIYVFRQAHGAPMMSLGIHLDLHTPRMELHLPLVTISMGRIVWEAGSDRFFYFAGERWSGHTDDCWHRESLVEVRADSGGVFPDGTTNHAQIDFGANTAESVALTEAEA